MFVKNLLMLSVLLAFAILPQHPTAAQSVFLEGEVFDGFVQKNGEVGPNFFFGDLKVGDISDVGRLTAREGGKATGDKVTIGQNGGPGTLVIDGFGSEVLTLTANGVQLQRGSIEVRNGGTLGAANGGSKLAVVDTFGTSTIRIDGAGSFVRAEFFELAQDPGESGALEITNGANMRILRQSDLGSDFIFNDAGGNASVRVAGLGSSFFLGTTSVVGGEVSGQTQLRIEDEGTVIVDRTLLINSLGSVVLDGGTLIGQRTDGRSLNVRGTLSGSGQVISNETRFSPFGASAAPRLDIRSGDFLRFNALDDNAPAERVENDGGEFTNFGGTIEVNGEWTNTSGLIAARNATFRADEWNLAGGAMRFLEGDNDVFGTVVNNAEISISGESTVNFFGDVENQTDIRIVEGSQAVFLGTLSGAGGFSDTGDVLVLGTLSPGNSPAEVDFAGDLRLDSFATTVLELAGNTLGSQYDHLDVAGNLELGGDLIVDLISGFQPNAGDTFDLFDFGSLAGAFGSITLPELNGGLRFDASRLSSTGELRVVGVPEPNSIALAILVSVTLAGRRNRQTTLLGRRQAASQLR